MLMILLPILVTGISYIVGAAVEKKNKQNEEARSERVAEAGKAKKK